MARLTINAKSVKRLEEFSVLLGESIESVIDTALDALVAQRKSGFVSTENNSAKPDSSNAKSTGSKSKSLDKLVKKNLELPEMEINANRVPDLAYTKILSATIEGKSQVEHQWIKILIHMIKLAQKNGFTTAQIQDEINERFYPGRVEKGRHKYYSELDMSLPALNANEVCKNIIEIAKKLKVGTIIGFEWREKKNAKHPGRKAQLRINATK